MVFDVVPHGGTRETDPFFGLSPVLRRGIIKMAGIFSLLKLVRSQNDGFEAEIEFPASKTT